MIYLKLNLRPCGTLGTLLNTLQPCYSTILFTLKMESVSKNTIFGLKMMAKNGLEKFILKSYHAGNHFSLLHKRDKNYKFSNKNNYFLAWRNFKIIFSRPLFTINSVYFSDEVFSLKKCIQVPSFNNSINHVYMHYILTCFIYILDSSNSSSFTF